MIEQTAEDIKLESKIDDEFQKFADPNSTRDEQYEALHQMNVLRAKRSDNQIAFMEGKMINSEIIQDGEVESV